MEQYMGNGKVFLDGSFQEKTVGIKDGRIHILPKEEMPKEGAKVYDAEGKRVVPGFLDIHTHGAVGVDVNAATAEELGKIGHFMATQGTTSWLCSVLMVSHDQYVSVSVYVSVLPFTSLVFVTILVCSVYSCVSLVIEPYTPFT